MSGAAFTATRPKRDPFREPAYIDKGALFSQCGTWRYRLWRYWEARPDTISMPVIWLMLNPSTADAEKLDPTIRRCVGFAQKWGFNGIEIVNLFALRSTDPKGLTKHLDPVGPGNDHVLSEYCRGTRGPVVAAWGAHGARYRRGAVVLTMLKRLGAGHLYHLGTTNEGHPLHPLYLPGSLEFPRALVPWPESDP